METVNDFLYVFIATRWFVMIGIIIMDKVGN